MRKEDARRSFIKIEMPYYKYYCYRCESFFIPYRLKPEKNPELPKKCKNCKSRYWAIPIDYFEQCIRCGQFWDRRNYDRTPTRNYKCPFCGRKDYRREDWEVQINYKKEIKTDIKLFNTKKKIDEQFEKKPYSETKKIKFTKHIEIDDEKSVLDRLKE